MTLISTNFKIPWLWNYNNQISIHMACLCLNASLDPSNNVSQTQQLWSLAAAAEAGEHLNGCLSPSLFETPPWTDVESVLWWIVPIRVQLLLSGYYYQYLDCSTTLPCDERWFECERYNIGSIVLFATISRTPSRRMRTVSISLLNRITASIDGGWREQVQKLFRAHTPPNAFICSDCCRPGLQSQFQFSQIVRKGV